MKVIDNILLEWSYRCPDGIVDMNDPNKVKILFEILKPISSELNGLYPYKDRCLPNVNNYSFDHPITILRNL